MIITLQFLVTELFANLVIQEFIRPVCNFERGNAELDFFNY